MKWLKVTVATDRQAEDIVANILEEAGAQGVVVEGDDENLQEQAGDSWDYKGKIVSKMPYGVAAYYPIDGREMEAYTQVTTRLQELKQMDGLPELGTLNTTTETVNDQDWISSWKAYFKPVRASDYIVIKPSWIEYRKDPDEIVLEIDPGLAFGTGSHETTQLCLQLMEQFMYRGDIVIDVGCGSGVLGLAAAKMGAGHVYALDNDPTAIEVTDKNAQINAVHDKLSIIESDLLTALPMDVRADLVVCNIIADVVLRLIPELARVLRPNGMFICSGIIDSRLKDVKDALESNCYRIIRVVRAGEWRAIACKNKIN